MQRCEHLRCGDCRALQKVNIPGAWMGEKITHAPSLAFPQGRTDEGSLRTSWTARCIAADDFEVQKVCSDFVPMEDDRAIKRTLKETQIEIKPLTEQLKKNIGKFLWGLDSLKTRSEEERQNITALKELLKHR